MNTYLTRHIIKIPSDVKVFCCDKRKVVFVKGSKGKKILQLPLKIKIFNNTSTLLVTNLMFTELSNHKKKTKKSLRGTTIALLKKTFLEVSTVLYKKLNLIGVGYKAFVINQGGLNLIHFKLGFSHSIYFKVPKNIKVSCNKSDKLLISSNDYFQVSQTAATIKNLKFPEPYKGKGISYSNEKIILKEGKKV